MRSWMHARFLVCCLCLVVPGGAARGEEAGPTEWTREAFEGLFPPPAPGWSVSEMELEQATAFMGELSSLLGQPEPVRYALRRSYSAGDRTIGVTLASEELQTASVILLAHGYKTGEEGLVPLAEEDTELREGRDQILSGGARPFETRGHLALEWDAPGETWLAVLLGDLGIALLECGYAGCRADLDSLARRLDLPRLEEFARFRHLRSD